jgi:hypothetical protein
MRGCAVLGLLAVSACAPFTSNALESSASHSDPPARVSAHEATSLASPVASLATAATAPPNETTGDDMPIAPAPPPPPEPFEAPLPDRFLSSNAPASRLANLSPGACKAELRKRNLPYKSAPGPSKGVATPVRITGPLRGVTFRAPAGRSPYGTLDCRLLLALDELAEVLARHRVTSVRVDNLHRPRARLPGRRKPSQHSYGLAADIMSFTLDDGSELVVERDWVRGPSGSACGPGARAPEIHAAGIALLNLVCDIARTGLFHHMLTPNHDEAHRDHLHFDLKRGDKLMILE